LSAVTAFAVASWPTARGRWSDEQAVAAHLAHGRLDQGSLFQV
jgi:hypothetical protein